MVRLSDAQLFICQVINNVGRTQECVSKKRDAPSETILTDRADSKHTNAVPIIEVGRDLRIVKDLLLVGEGIDDHLAHGNRDCLSVKLEVEANALTLVFAIGAVYKGDGDILHAQDVEGLVDGLYLSFGQEADGGTRVENGGGVFIETVYLDLLALWCLDLEAFKGDGEVGEVESRRVRQQGQSCKLADELFSVETAEEDSSLLGTEVVLPV